jgi:hypothetical protein
MVVDEYPDGSQAGAHTTLAQFLDQTSQCESSFRQPTIQPFGGFPRKCPLPVAAHLARRKAAGLALERRPL